MRFWTRWSRIVGMALLAVLFSAIAVVAFAQTGETPPAVAIDWTKLLTDLALVFIGVLGSGAAIAIVTTLVKMGLPMLPRWAVPILTMLLGLLGAWIDKLLTGGQFSPLIAAAIGAAAVWVREITTTVQQHGNASVGSVTFFSR